MTELFPQLVARYKAAADGPELDDVLLGEVAAIRKARRISIETGFSIAIYELQCGWLAGACEVRDDLTREASRLRQLSDSPAQWGHHFNS